MENPIVKVEHLYHRYTSSRWAIEDINFQIDEAGVVGLLGSNGAGKSTTMNIICGVLKQTKGKVYINGVDTLKNPEVARGYIGFLPQKPPLYPDLTVNEYLNFCAEIHWMERKSIKAAVKRVEERCGVYHMKDRLLRNLSGGYQQRVGIAQAILHDPKFVVLDEPTNGLDPNQIVEIRNLVKEIAVDRAVMLSTHILPEVQATCDEIRMIEHGKVVFSGSMDDFDNYVAPTSFTATLVNAPAIEELVKLKGITSVDCLGDCHYRFHIAETDGITEKMIATSVANGWQLEEIQLERLSLDEIFARLSGKK